MPAEEFIGVKDIATMMGVDPRTVGRWCRLGIFRPYRIGHTVRFKRSHVLQVLEKHRNFEPMEKSKEDILMG